MSVAYEKEKKRKKERKKKKNARYTAPIVKGRLGVVQPQNMQRLKRVSSADC
jgi:hypothetical protein